MNTIQVNYDEVHAETAQMRQQIASDVVNRANSEYRQMLSQLNRADGATMTQLREIMEGNRQKTITYTDILEKLAVFISISSEQIETVEQQIARTMSSNRM